MTKTDEVIARLVDWATIESLCKEFGQLPHSLRALISVQARKRGLTIERQRIDGVTSYRVAPAKPKDESAAVDTKPEARL